MRIHLQNVHPIDDDDNTDHRSKEEEQGIGDSFLPSFPSIHHHPFRVQVQIPVLIKALLLSPVDYDDDDDKLDDQIKVSVQMCVSGRETV
jgi:hypothetical protein